MGRQFVFTRLDSDDAIDGVISGTLGDPGMARCGAKAGLSWMHKQDGLPRIRIDVVAAERKKGEYRTPLHAWIGGMKYIVGNACVMSVE